MMEAMRESWTDGRMDDLSRRIDERFDRVDEQFDRVDERFGRVDERFKQVDERFKQVDERFRQVDGRFDRVEGDLRAHRTETRTEFAALRGEMNTRFDTTQYLIIRVGAAMFATLVIGFLSLLLAQL